VLLTSFLRFAPDDRFACKRFKGHKFKEFKGFKGFKGGLIEEQRLHLVQEGLKFLGIEAVTVEEAA